MTRLQSLSASCASVSHAPVLYGRAPIGVGTPLVESLSGYLGHLCEARCVAVTDVLDELVRPLVPAGLIRPYENLSWFLHVDARRIDGVGVLPSAFVPALERLTGHRRLSVHTCLAWRELVSVAHGGVLAQCAKRWCSSCLAQWADDGIEPWQPLLWRLRAVNRCPFHRVPLSERCASCGHRPRVLAETVPYPHCDRCGNPLYLEDPNRFSVRLDPSGDPDPLWEWWTSVAVAHMLALQTDPDLLASASGFSSLLERTMRRYRIGLSPIGRRVGIVPAALFPWRAMTAQPPIPKFVRMCMLLGEHPALVAYPDLSDRLSQCWSPWPALDHPWPRPTAASFDSPSRKAFEARWARAARALDEAIAAGGVVSLRSFAESLGEHDAALRKRFPDRYAKLRNLQAAKRAADRRRYSRALDAALARPDPPSMESFTESLGLASGVLQRLFPDRSARLIRLHSEYRARLRRGLTLRRCQEVSCAVEALVRAGKRPTLHATLLSVPLPLSLSKVPSIRAAWLDALRACGLSAKSRKPFAPHAAVCPSTARSPD